jgi:hypothetical protein
VAKPLTARAAGLIHGWRSGLEEAVGDQLKKAGVDYEYEPFRIPYFQPAKPRHFTPDFVILNNGIVVETKGRFVTADRQKHLLIKLQYPELDLRFVFSNSRARISKQSKTTYAKWCETKGFKYADRWIPQEWLEESINVASFRVLQKLREK